VFRRNGVLREKVIYDLLESGQRSLIHDFGDSFGGVKVLQGVPTESLFELAPNGMIKPSSSKDYQPADIQIEHPITIHQVSNLQTRSLTTISFHV
jgi:cysteine dioxygenase